MADSPAAPQGGEDQHLLPGSPVAETAVRISPENDAAASAADGAAYGVDAEDAGVAAGEGGNAEASEDGKAAEPSTDGGAEASEATEGDAIIEVAAGSQEAEGSTVKARDTAAIKAAYDARDVEASKAAHDGGYAALASEKHQTGGGYLKSVIYGAMDGIQTVFAVISGAAGGGLSVGVILILGFSNLLANGFGMGVCDALSEAAEMHYIRSERVREQWEFENYKEGEVREMEELFQEKGMTETDAKRVIEIMSKYDKYFVDLMMSQELDLQVPGDDESPVVNGFVTFGSFVVFGVVPLLVYVIFAGLGWSPELLFGVSIALTAVTLFALGAIKGHLTGARWWWSGSEMLFTGAVTAAASYGIAYAVGMIVGGAGCSA